ncbi:hypothetical protein HU200_061480 [Digitaria exilis]|uniref:Uncharacterized protein n=1 Tax=Digitaria exilis TaxID=1010633 RepID=A0A835A7A7_9POAL|nr:hypothetical protein HU200_061480 [Digitaria exilis]
MALPPLRSPLHRRPRRRHPDQPPLVVVGYQATDRNGRVLCDIVDLSGRVVKRVHAAAGDEDDDDSLGRTTKWVMSTQGDLVCVTRGTGMSCCQLLDPATGAVHDLPDGLAAEHSDHYSSDCWGSTVPDEARWRKAQAPPYGLELLCHDNGVVINGIVYFLLKPDEWDDTRQGLVGSYDLEMEKWRPGIQEPLSCQYETCHNGNWAFLQNYNNPIDIVIDVLQRKDVEVGLYGGNLLSLANGTS